MPQILCALALLPALACAAETPAGKKPNILWIVSEDNDPFLGCYGDRFAKTPNLDKLAAEGVLYRNNFANAPVCAPSRCTMITGMYASSLGTLHMRSTYRVPDDAAKYCQYMQDAGYYCMNPGKTDYNLSGGSGQWNRGKTWKDAPPGKPWMLVINSMTTHESCLHGSVVHEEYLKEPFKLPPYHPDTPEIRSNWVEYYHKITKLDAEFGAVLDRLEKDGLADDTIVFYYSDHGGILPRSKRFVYDSGLHAPLIIRFGKNFQHLAPAPAGTKLDRLVSFIDLPPSILSLAGGKIPAHYQGQAYLGPQAVTAEREYVFGFRGRMDERYDLSYTVRDKRYRYIRNYMPHRIYGQHLNYLWLMPAAVSWEKAYLAGKCDATQSAFWRPKPIEELFDEPADPYEVKNLAENPGESQTLARMRGALHEQLLQNRDAGFLPEAEMVVRAKGDPIQTMTRDETRYPFARVLEAADVAAGRDAASVPKLVKWMGDPDAAVRYWAALGCCVRGQAGLKETAAALPALEPLLKDPSSSVRITAAEGMCWLGRADAGLPALVDALDGEPFDALLALNALEALGDIARPSAAQIAAKAGRLQKPKGEDYPARAAASLLAKLQAPPVQ